MIKQMFFIVILLSTMMLTLGCKNYTEDVKILEEKPVKNTVEFETTDIFLTQIHLDNFREYEKTGNEQLLKDLSPTDIFKYYYRAYKLDNVETLYGFYIKGQKHQTPNRKQFLNNYEKKGIVQMALLNKLEENIESLAQIKYDENTVYVQVKFKENNEFVGEKPWNFKLIKNSEGIWKMDWIPLKGK